MFIECQHKACQHLYSKSVVGARSTFHTMEIDVQIKRKHICGKRGIRLNYVVRERTVMYCVELGSCFAVNVFNGWSSWRV